jgi:general stress protein YciG
MSDKKPVDPNLSRKRSEAGKKGGTATKTKHGKEHFAKIGAMGGAAPHERPPATAPQDTGESDDTP